MGIFIYLQISKSVTQEEWEKVYEETLQLMKSLPFAEHTYADIHNIKTICLVPSKEREETDFFQNPKIGWRASGDYVTMREAEDYYIPRHLLGKILTTQIPGTQSTVSSHLILIMTGRMNGFLRCIISGAIKHKGNHTTSIC